MRQHYGLLLAIMLLLIVGIGCNTKEINLITNIDFELTTTNSEVGFVKDSLATSIIITPQSVDYPGFQYFTKYAITKGEGYFVAADSTLIPADEDIQLHLKEEAYTANWMYIATTAGTHSVRIEARDNYNRYKETNLIYEIKPIELLWEVGSPQTMAQVNDTIPLTLQLENLSEGAELTYERIMRISEGAGVLLDTDKKPISFNKTGVITEGTHALYYVSTVAGSTSLQFDLTANTGTEKTTAISFDIQEVLVNEAPVIVPDEAETFATTAVSIPVLDNDTDPEEDALTITSVTAPTNGTASIENNEIRYTPNAAFIGKEVFNYTIMDSAGNEVAGGVITITVSPRETIAIPDDNFEAALIVLELDDVPDNKMFKDVAEGVTSLDVSNKGIESLEGIEFFITLETLIAKNNAIKSIDLSQNEVLGKLDLESNQLTTLDVSNNTALTWLNFWKNQVSSIDLSQNINLVYLDADENDLTILDVSQNMELENLTLNGNNVSNLDIADKVNLKVLGISNRNGNDNAITDLDISRLVALEDLGIDGLNMLNELDFSANTKLKKVYAVGISNWDAADFSNNPDLELARFSNSSLKSINIQNGSNALLTSFDVSGSTNLTCIQVDDVQVAKARTDWLKDEAVYYSRDCSQPRETIAIPDDNFEDALIALELDDVPDNKMFKDVAEGITSLDVSDKGIESLEGIEWFTALELLSAKENVITELDVSKNLNLISINLESNQISELDVTRNLELTTLKLGRNTISAMDVSQNSALNYLSLFYNNLTNIDISNNPELQFFSVDQNNEFGEIDLSKNTKLTQLGLADNKLTSIDLSNNPLIFILNVFGTLLDTIDVTNLTKLRYLNAFNSKFTTIDLSRNVELQQLRIENSQYQSIDLSTLTSLTKLDATNNPNLSCIQVSDIDAANARTDWLKDDTAHYSLDCSQPRATIAIPDDNFEQALIDLGHDEGALDNKMFKDVAESIETLNLDNLGIENLDGIEYFIALEDLRVSNNNLSTIDLSQNAQLRVFWIKDNQLTNIDLSANSQLEIISLTGNPIPSVDLSNNLALTQLGLARMPLTTIDVTKNIALTTIWVSNTQITAIDVSRQPDLTDLYLYDNQLTTVDVNSNTKLRLLRVDQNQMTSLDLRGLTALTTLNAQSNATLGCIQVDDVQDAKAKTNWQKNDNVYYSLDCSQPRETIAIPDDNFEQALFDFGYDEMVGDNKMFRDVAEGITSLDVANQRIESLEGIEFFTALENLTAVNNDLSSLQLSENKLLKTLNLKNNNITAIDISNQALLTALYLESNQLTTIDVTSNTALTTLQVGYNQITSLDLTKNLLLRTVGVFVNELNAIDVSQNSEITFLDLTRNNLTTIDLSQNLKLRQLGLGDNQLTTIDLSTNSALYEIEINSNQFSNVDFSMNPSLNRIAINNNVLIGLDVSSLSSLNSLNVLDNLGLTCIKVGDIAKANSQVNWTKDDTATYNTVCP